MLSLKQDCLIESRFNTLKVSSLSYPKDEDSWVSSTRKLDSSSKLPLAEEFDASKASLLRMNSQFIDDEYPDFEKKTSTPFFSRLNSINNCQSASQSLSIPSHAFDTSKSFIINSEGSRYINYLLNFYLSQAKIEERSEKIKFNFFKLIEVKDEIRQLLHISNYSGGKYFVCLLHSSHKTIGIWSTQGFSNKIKVDFDITEIFYLKDFKDHNIFCTFSKSFLYLFIPSQTTWKKIYVYKEKKLHFSFVRTLSKSENSFNRHLILLKDVNEKLIIFFCIETEQIVKRLRLEFMPVIFDYVQFNHEDYSLCSAGEQILAVKSYPLEHAENSEPFLINHKYDGLVLAAKLQEILVWSDSLYQLYILVSVNKSPKEKHFEIRQITESYCLMRIEFDVTIIGFEFFSCRLDHTLTNHYIVAKSMNCHQLWKFNCKYDPDIDSVEATGLSEESFIYTDEKPQQAAKALSNNSSSGSGSMNKENRGHEGSHSSKEELYPNLIAFGNFSFKQDKISLFPVFNSKKKSKILCWMQGYEKEIQ